MMARIKQRRKTRELVPDGADGIATWCLRHLDALQVLNYAQTTIDGRHRDLWRFKHWCNERSLISPREITKPVLERYQRHLYHFRHDDEGALSFDRQAGLLSAVKLFFKWLTQHNHLLFNPASELILPRQARRRLTDRLLSLDAVETIMEQPNLATPYGIRDRAILELFYSTGVRRRECADLQLYDMDVDRGTVFIRQGKGRKDRVVPIGERALYWLECYTQTVRPSLSFDPTETHLFISYQGARLVPDGISHLVREYFQRAGVTKQGGAHMLRHTMATEMLNNGADIRYIQEMLGHATLDTTQRYTHVSIQKLKEIHATTHPGAALKYQGKALDEETLEALLDDE